MKLTKYSILALVTLVMGLASCEKDNYDAPEATIVGQITDQSGKPFQTAAGKTDGDGNTSGSMSIQLIETSYAQGDGTVIPQYLNMKQDGSFENIHLFAGSYEVTPLHGAFYPDVETQKVELKSGQTTTVNFSVTPYVELEWVKEPYLTSDNYLKASFRFKRNIKDGAPDVKDCCMWISRTQYCGTEGDSNYTPSNLTITNDQEGQEIELTSKIPIKYSMTYWVRIGVRSNDTYQKYNFTDIKEVAMQLH